MASMDDIRDMPEGAELSDEMLEGVSGGELNRLQEGLLDAMIRNYKERGGGRSTTSSPGCRRPARGTTRSTPTASGGGMTESPRT